MNLEDVIIAFLSIGLAIGMVCVITYQGKWKEIYSGKVINYNYIKGSAAVIPWMSGTPDTHIFTFDSGTIIPTHGHLELGYSIPINQTIKILYRSGRIRICQDLIA